MDNTLITKDRVKAWNACSGGFKWFLDNYKPAEAEFVTVYQHLIRANRNSDADWLMGKLFEELCAEIRVKLVTQIAGADARLIAEQQESGVPGVTTEDDANAATTGYHANAATTGYRANAATTGYHANAATTGSRANAATTGKCAVAASLGIEARAKASVGGAIVLAWRDQQGKLLGIRSAMIGENGIQPDVWYELNDSGEFTAVE